MINEAIVHKDKITYFSWNSNSIKPVITIQSSQNRPQPGVKIWHHSNFDSCSLQSFKDFFSFGINKVPSLQNTARITINGCVSTVSYDDGGHLPSQLYSSCKVPQSTENLNNQWKNWRCIAKRVDHRLHIYTIDVELSSMFIIVNERAPLERLRYIWRVNLI